MLLRSNFYRGFMMAMTNAQRQAAYRSRVKDSTDQRRVHLVVDAATDTALEELAARYGVTKTEALGLAMQVVVKDEAEAVTRAKATGKKYRSAFERQLAERSAT